MKHSIPHQLAEATLASAAVEYARAGLPVIPLKPGGKVPLGKAAPRGSNSATADQGQVEKWWAEHPEANIGIATGRRSGLVVIDIDGREGQETAERLGLPPTLTCKTGRGEHRYYSHDAGNVKNGVSERGGLGPGVDIRGEGGYVVAPPSIHSVTRRAYAWCTTGPRNPAPLPSEVLNSRHGRKPGGSVQDRLAVAAKRPASELPESPISALRPSDVPVGSKHGLERLAHQFHLLSREASPDDGGSGRNHRLNEVSYICGQLEGAGHLDAGYVEEVIIEAAEQCGLVSDDGPAAVEKTFASGFESGQETAAEVSVSPGPWHRPQDLRRGTDGFQLLTLEDLESLPPVEYLITGILPARGLVSLFGPPGAYKSFVALDWALTVASGRAWAGQACEQGYAVYIASEGSSGLLKRARAWRHEHPSAAPGKRFRVIARAVRLNASEDMRELHRALREQLDESPRLIVVDTLARSAPGAEENSAKDMGLVVEAVDAIRHEFGSTVVLVHHTPRDAPHRERGSTALEGAMDMRWSVTRRNSEGTLRCLKAKEGEDGRSISFAMRSSLGSLVVDTASDARVRIERERAVEAVTEALDDWRRQGKVGWPSFSHARQFLAGRNEEKRRVFEEAGADPGCAVLVRTEGETLRVGLKESSQLATS